VIEKRPTKLGFIGKKMTRKASFNEIGKDLLPRGSMRKKGIRLAGTVHSEE
jgi:hypothetical protein